MSERREVVEGAWRLAVLLSPDALRARRVVERAAFSRGDFVDLPASRRRRLVILRSRELAEGRRRKRRSLALSARRWLEAVRRDRRRKIAQRGRKTGTPASGQQSDRARSSSHREPKPTRSGLFTDDAGAAHAALQRLDHQQREAWILHELDGLAMLEISRAMDCSRTAAQRHLTRGREAMRAALGEDLARATAALRDAAEALEPPKGLSRRVGPWRGLRRWKRAALWLLALVALLVVAFVIARWLPQVLAEDRLSLRQREAARDRGSVISLVSQR